MPSVTYDDYAHARLIVVWGANPSASGIHLVPFIQRGAASRAPRSSWSTRARRRSRAWPTCTSPLRPGTDLAVALALHRHLFESGLADEAFLEAHTTGAEALRERAAEWTFERAADVAGRAAADHRANSPSCTPRRSPALIRCGWGLERNRNGGSAAAAVLALPAVGGQVRRARRRLHDEQLRRRGASSEAWIGDRRARTTRVVNMNHLGRVLTESADPPVKVLFVYNCNPLATVPDQNRVRQRPRARTTSSRSCSTR